MRLKTIRYIKVIGVYEQLSRKLKGKINGIVNLANIIGAISESQPVEGYEESEIKQITDLMLKSGWTMEAEIF